MTKHEQVIAYADPYASPVYELDKGHGWDRLAAIAGEYQRGEITWERAQELCDENVRDMQRAQEEDA